MKKLLFVVVLAFALLPASGLAQNQDGNDQGGNNNQGLNTIKTITATEMSEIGVAVATLLGAVVYLGMRRRAQSKQ